MLDLKVEFDLPQPWSGGKKFKTEKVGYINFLVGPNGSGKSKFANALKGELREARLLGTDRLSGMEQSDPMRDLYGDRLQGGYEKGHFQHFKSAGEQGSGIDTLIVLEERMDLRIQVEATLSHLFNRKIFLEWDSGKLLARATLGTTGASYRLDRDECHGIKELLVLLTNLYNDQYPYLIIDEPELNLHPQYQAFFMQEVRKIAGVPGTSEKKKVVFLITHSPFMLDFKSMDDVRSVISFGLDHDVPCQIFDLAKDKADRIESLVPRLNVHHKQLFFSDSPVFVEGILDAQLIAAMQDSRGVSIAAAGSCIIDAGGCEEVNKYLDLCMAFGKKAHFLYDLDSLFTGNLKACIRDDGEVQSFLATAGLGSDLGKYCGELERKLTNVIDMLLSCNPQGELATLLAYMCTLGPRAGWDGKTLSKARVAVLTAISRHKEQVSAATSAALVDEVVGRLNKIICALMEKNIHLLPGGTIERYLPKYQGNYYELKDEAKRKAIEEEIQELSAISGDEPIRSRYGELFNAVSRLPSKLSVDVDKVIKVYLSQYIHDLQITAIENPKWTEQEVVEQLKNIQKSTVRVFSVRRFVRGEPNKFSVEVVISPMLGKPERIVRVSEATNAGMHGYEISNT